MEFCDCLQIRQPNCERLSIEPLCSSRTHPCLEFNMGPVKSAGSIKRHETAIQRERHKLQGTWLLTADPNAGMSDDTMYDKCTDDLANQFTRSSVRSTSIAACMAHCEFMAHCNFMAHCSVTNNGSMRFYSLCCEGRRALLHAQATER